MQCNWVFPMSKSMWCWLTQSHTSSTLLSTSDTHACKQSDASPSVKVHRYTRLSVCSCHKVKTVPCDSWGISKYTPFGVHFTVQFSLQSQSLPNRLVGVSVAIKNACCADKGPTSTRSCPDSGIAIATPDTPTTFTCSRYKGALGRSLCRID